MRVFNWIIVILATLGLGGFVFFFLEFSAIEADLYQEKVGGVMVAIALILTLYILLANIILMLIALIVIVVNNRLKDRFSKITLFYTLAVVLVELVMLFPYITE